MRYTDYSRTATDWVCPRARYWGYEQAGIGVSPVEPEQALSFGIAIAAAAQAIREGKTVPAYTGSPPWSALYAGLTDAYRTRIWPEWSRDYELVAAEIEVQKPLAAGIVYQVRPDAVVRRRSDRTHWIMQDKTTSQSPQNFAGQWAKHAELHATALVTGESLGIDVAGTFVQGWYKGYQKQGTLYSPLAYCWLKPAQPGVGKPQPSFEYRAGWPRVPITDLDVPTWVKSLPDALIRNQFPITQPIPLRRDFAQTYLEQVCQREQQIAAWRAAASDEATVRQQFPQHFTNCHEFSVYRRPCAWHDCCWAPMVTRDPMASGLFVQRTPHHAPEREGQA